MQKETAIIDCLFFGKIRSLGGVCQRIRKTLSGGNVQNRPLPNKENHEKISLIPFTYTV
nr:MAG TPA: hypothetical protein [Caudoviricetes sp.]